MVTITTKSNENGGCLKSADVIRLLKANGWELVRVKGDHHQFRKEGSPYVVTVPHPTKDIKIGTLKSIQRLTGITMK